jgi:hypothetical protein
LRFFTRATSVQLVRIVSSAVITGALTSLPAHLPVHGCSRHFFQTKARFFERSPEMPRVIPCGYGRSQNLDGHLEPDGSFWSEAGSETPRRFGLVPPQAAYVSLAISCH